MQTLSLLSEVHPLNKEAYEEWREFKHYKSTSNKQGFLKNERHV